MNKHALWWYVVMHAAHTSLFNESWLMNVIYQSYLCKNFWTGNKKYKSPSGLNLTELMTYMYIFVDIRMRYAVGQQFREIKHHLNNYFDWKFVAIYRIFLSLFGAFNMTVLHWKCKFKIKTFSFYFIFYWNKPWHHIQICYN